MLWALHVCVSLSRVHTSTKEEDYLQVIDGVPAPLPVLGVVVT